MHLPIELTIFFLSDKCYNILGGKMKKLMLIGLLFFGLMFNVQAQEKLDVSFVSCVDGDTANFILNGKEIKVRFLAVDTPETSHPTKGEEPYGKEAKKYTCNSLTKAKNIQLEFDDGSEKKDKYGRYLAWIWVDDYLLQDNLIKEGLAEVAYLYGDYKYTGLLQDHEAIAKLNKVGKWSDYNPMDKNILYLIGGIALILIATGTGLLTKSKGKKYTKKLLKKYGK